MDDVSEPIIERSSPKKVEPVVEPPKVDQEEKKGHKGSCPMTMAAKFFANATIGCMIGYGIGF